MNNPTSITISALQVPVYLELWQDTFLRLREETLIYESLSK